jgi:hypothetical protein
MRGSQGLPDIAGLHRERADLCVPPGLPTPPTSHSHAEMRTGSARISMHSVAYSSALFNLADDHRAHFSSVLVGNQIADYLRLSRSTEALWPPRQILQFCASAAVAARDGAHRSAVACHRAVGVSAGQRPGRLRPLPNRAPK